MNFDSPSSFSSPSSGGGDSVDPQLQTFIQQETQRAELQTRVHKLNDMCWDLCLDKPRDKLDSRTETCMSNCVERFIDVSLLIAKKFQHMQQKGISPDWCTEETENQDPSSSGERFRMVFVMESPQRYQSVLIAEHYAGNLKVRHGRLDIILDGQVLGSVKEDNDQDSPEEKLSIDSEVKVSDCLEEINTRGQLIAETIVSFL